VREQRVELCRVIDRRTVVFALDSRNLGVRDVLRDEVREPLLNGRLVLPTIR